MFNNSSHIDASHSTFSEVHRDQYYSTRSTVQGNQTINTIVHGNQILQDTHSSLVDVLQKASAPSAAYDSAQRYPAPKCIEGTRIELLARIVSWVDEPDEKSICWLNGRPGSGKSAVSQTIAEKYASEERLAASFFFSRRDVERHTTQHVVPTLTIQLLAFLPSIRPAVIKALERDYMLPMKVLREQMEKLLLEPLSTATETPAAPILIIIDALDECDDESLVSELVALVALLPRKTSLPLRLLITSRSEPWIQSQFHKPDISALTLSLEIHAFSAEVDIRSFLRHALDDTYDQHLQVMGHLPRPWPPSDELERVVNKAGGLFIFALTVAKFVGDRTHNPVERLQAILEDKATGSAGSAYTDLDSLYRDAISVFPDADVARLVLGVVYCMAIPLSISGLHKLLQRPDVDARLIVPALSSVLLASEDGKQPIQFYHASFRDFLIDQNRSKKYAINPEVYHRFMAQLCFDTMSSSLKRDMCGIGDPAIANNEVPDLSERRQVAFDEAVLYACRFWSRHLAQLPSDGVASETLLSALKRFSTTVLLHWIEGRSIFGELEGAVVMLREGISWLRTLNEPPKDTLTLFEDAERLVVLYMDCISQCALQVYSTALSFAPSYSAIYLTFKHQALSTLTMYPRRSHGWASVRRDFNFHTAVHSVVFSPNGELIATAGMKHGVQVWSTITGGNVASLGDHSSTSLLVRFSPSGAFLAAAFEGGTVAVWDPKVGGEHLKDEGCHTDTITCMEFSTNSVLLASGSLDHVIQVWSVERAERLYRLASHEGAVRTLVFSSNSGQLFSGSEDNLLIIWDMSTGKIVRGLMGHRKPVNCVAVSKDGRLLASGSEDKTIKMWDTGSSKCTETFKGHQTGIRSVHFFDGDSHLVGACDRAIISWTIGSRSKPVTLWAAEEFAKTTLKRVPAWQAKALGWGAPKSVLRLFMDKTFTGSTPRSLTTSFASRSPTLVFMHRGLLFVGSVPNVVNGVPRTSTGTATITSVSSDGNWAATADALGSLQIVDLTIPERTWDDIEASAKSEPFRATEKVIPSPDGARFIVDNLFKWYLVDAEFRVVKKIDTGMMGSMRGNDDIRFAFSADGTLFFSVVLNLFNDDKSRVHVFDAVTGDQRTQFSGLKKVHGFAASASGAWFACGHGQGQVDVFDVARSGGGSGGSSSGAARTSMRVPEGGGDDDDKSSASHVSVLAFSDDGDARTLVGGSQDGTVYVWDRASGACTATLRASSAASPSPVTALAHVQVPASEATGTDADAHAGADANTSGRDQFAIAIGRQDGSLSVWYYDPSRSKDAASEEAGAGNVVVVLADEATAPSKHVDLVRFVSIRAAGRPRLTSRGEDGTICTWAVLPPPAGDREDGEGDTAQGGGTPVDERHGSEPNAPRPRHLLARSDPDDAPDSLFHTTYRVRKDGWLVHGEDEDQGEGEGEEDAADRRHGQGRRREKRMVWLPPSVRPRGKDVLYAYPNGLMVFFTPSEILVFLKLGG